MIKDLPILVIVIPLLSAFIIPLAARINRAWSWYIATFTTFISLAGSVLLLKDVQEKGRISYWLGGFEPPWGIEYAIDYLNGFVLVVVAFVAFLVAVYARKSVEHEIEESKTSYFYSIYLLFTAGLTGMVITGDVFNLYVFLEIASLTGYALIAMGRRREALIASYNYLIMGTIGATFILLGIGYLYMVTGTLNMADLGQRLPEIYQSGVVRVAFAFFAIGLSIKIALFPLHNWLPNAYTYAPSTVSAILAATATKVGAYTLIRVLFTVFKPEFSISEVHLCPMFFFFSATAILAGSILAIAQTDIKKMLAYSSIGQIGYIVLGIALLNHTGMKAAILHILNHALMKGTLFLVVGAVVYSYGITNISDFKRLGKKLPIPMAAFTVAALSMIGVPLTVGFVSKWYLAVASLEAGMWFFIPILLFSSLLMAVYFWRVIDYIYFHPEEEVRTDLPYPGPSPSAARGTPALMLGPIAVMAALCIVFGIDTSLPLSIADKASTILLMK